VSTYLYGSKYAPTYITDPDGNSVYLTYDGVGRMTGRRTRRGSWTTYTYTGQLHVDSARVACPKFGGQRVNVGPSPART
jgi:YD repeat-containing protein